MRANTGWASSYRVFPNFWTLDVFFFLIWCTPTCATRSCETNGVRWQGMAQRHVRHLVTTVGQRSTTGTAARGEAGPAPPRSGPQPFRLTEPPRRVPPGGAGRGSRPAANQPPASSSLGAAGPAANGRARAARAQRPPGAALLGALRGAAQSLGPGEQRRGLGGGGAARSR